MSTITGRQPSHHPCNDDGPKNVRALFVAGGGFATTVATVLGVAGRYDMGDQAVLYALGAVCLIAALTLFLGALLMRGK